MCIFFPDLELLEKFCAKLIKHEILGLEVNHVF